MTKVALALLLLLPLSPQTVDDGLGRISFPTSGSAEAQPHFIRGVLLLHSFEFDDAAEAFREARRVDPGFAMAYWGEALTWNHPLWRYQNREAALKVLAELGPTPEARLAKAPTAREKAYLATLDVLYGDGPKAERDRAYVRALAGLSARFPDDDEAKAFHALAILGTNIERRDFNVDMRAAAIVEEVFMRNQEHPGVLHYMIHAYDNPMHAPLGLRAAERYGRIARHAAHALHMTSHIFFAMGMWDEAAEANEASWEASRRRLEQKNLGPEENGFHAYLWLAYGYLQQNRIDDARRVVDHIGRLLETTPTSRVSYHYGAARAAWIVDAERWDDLPPLPNGMSTAPPSAMAASVFADGLAAARRGDLPNAEQALARLRELVPAQTGETHHGMNMSPADRAGLAITAKQMEGIVALAKGDAAAGIALLQEAAAAEAVMSFEYGPPFPVKPANELLGEALLAAGRRDEAADAFRAALQRTPGRRLSLAGLEKAEATDRTARAR